MMKKLLVLLLPLFVFASDNDKCYKALLRAITENSKHHPELREVLESKELINAWSVIYSANGSGSNDLLTIIEVADDLDLIEQLGGYDVWASFRSRLQEEEQWNIFRSDLINDDFRKRMIERPELVEVWEAMIGLTPSIRNNEAILSKGDELLRLGFSKSNFKALASWNDVNVLDIAKRMRNNHIVDGTPIGFNDIIDLVDNSYLLGKDFVTSLDNISKGPGKLLDHSGLKSKLRVAVDTSDPLEGIRLTMDDAGLRIKNGSNVEIENANADLEDFTLHESVQHKLMKGGDSQLANNINKAAKQLRGKTGEKPQFPNKIIHLKIWKESNSTFKDFTKQQLFDYIGGYDAVNYDLKGATRLIIENEKGKHVFSIIDGVLALD